MSEAGKECGRPWAGCLREGTADRAWGDHVDSLFLGTRFMESMSACPLPGPQCQLASEGLLLFFLSGGQLRGGGCHQGQGRPV